MRLESRACLADIERAATRIQEALAGISLDAYLSGWEKQSAVERQFLILGEALVRIRNLESPVFDAIPDAPKIVAFRNILVHGYDALDAESIFRLAQEPLEELRSAAANLLGGES